MAVNNALNLKITGVVCADGAGAFLGRTITAPAAGITVADGDGVSGNPTMALADDLAAVEALASTGVVSRTASDTWAANSITEGAVLLGGASEAVTDTGVLAKGSLIVGDGVTAPVALAVGTNDFVLTADSAEASGQKWAIQNSPGAVAVKNGWIENISLDIDSGVFTLVGMNDAALSSTNPGFITMRSNVDNSKFVRHEITSALTIDITDMDGNLFGTTASTAWSGVGGLPLYFVVFADSSDANLVFGLARVPHNFQTPSAAGSIGDPSAANCDTQQGVFAGQDITEANFLDMRICTLGYTAFSKSSSDVWTIEFNGALGHFAESTTWGMPQGQNGAAASNFWASNGGTIPTWSTQDFQWTLDRNGQINVYYRANGDPGADGSGAVSAQLVMPLEVEAGLNSGTAGIYLGEVQIQRSGANFVPHMAYVLKTSPLLVQFTQSDNTGADRLYSGFGNGARNVQMHVQYLVDREE